MCWVLTWKMEIWRFRLSQQKKVDCVLTPVKVRRAAYTFVDKQGISVAWNNTENWQTISRPVNLWREFLRYFWGHLKDRILRREVLNYLWGPEGQSKAKVAAVNKKVVRKFYRIYFETVADFKFPEKAQKSDANFTLQQAMKAQRGCGSIALLFL